MPRDYAKKPRSPSPKAKPRSRVPRWVWLFTSSVAVLFAGGLFFLSQLPEDGEREQAQFEWPSIGDLVPDSPRGEEPLVAEPEPAPEEEAPSLSRRAQLEFYTLLQQTDVFVPDEVVALRQRQLIEDADETISDLREGDSPTESPDSAPSSAPAGQFVIQVASFSNAGDAENLRANLILEGLTSAHVTEADLGEQGVFHRVMIGPVQGTRETQDIGNRLEAMGLQGLVRNHNP